MKRSETSAFFSCAERTITRINQNKHNNYQGRRKSKRLPCFHIYVTFKKEMMNYKAIQTLKGNGGIPRPKRVSK